jgi:nucleoside 2-deoxyribosyltransferase
LAGPIGDKSIEEANIWRDKVQQYFDRQAMNLLCDHVQCRNPLRGKTESNRTLCTDAEIVIRDKNDIKDSDFIIVNWPEKCVSNGTAMEIQYAHSLNKPIMFVGEWAKNDVWIRFHITDAFYELDNALDYIQQMWM